MGAYGFGGVQRQVGAPQARPYRAYCIRSLASEMREMRSDFTNVIGRVETIEKKPLKRYDLIVNSGITAIVSGLAGFLMSSLIK